MDDYDLHEEWQDIPGYEGYYQASSLGRLRSLDRTVVGKNGYIYPQKGRILCCRHNRYGYLQVNFCNNQGCKTVLVHRMVAKTFIPNPENKFAVDHINGIKDDNAITNLQWVTPRENTHFAIDLGLINSEKFLKRVRSDEHLTRLHESRKRPVIRDDGKIYDSVLNAAKDVNRSSTSILDVLCHRSHTCAGHTYNYLSREEYNERVSS